MNIFKESGIARLAKGWDALYEQSYTKQLWDAYAEAPDPAESSCYGRFLLWLEGLLTKASALFRGSFCNKIFNHESLKRWMFIAFAAYLPIEYVLRDVLALSIASVWEELFILAALALVIWRTLSDRIPGSFSRTTALEPVLLLYIVVGLILMLLNCPYPYIAVAGYRAQFEYIVWFFLILRLIDDRKDARFLLWAFLAVVFCLSLHGIYQFIIAVPIPSSWVSQSDASVRTRVYSLTGSPNIFGSLLVLAAPSSAALIYYAEKPRAKIFFLCTTGIICLADLFTFSRGSWVGLVLAVIIFAMYADKRIFGFMLAAITTILVAVPTIASRIAYLFTSDYTKASRAGGRSVRWETGKLLLHENSPWLGFGLGRFGGAVAMNNQVLDETDDFSYFYMDNYYLKTLVETGYIGLICFILCLVCFVLLAIKAIHKAGDGYRIDKSLDPLMRNVGNDKLLCVGIFCGMCGVMAHCYFENIFEEPYMMAYFWGLAAVLLSFGITGRGKLE